MQKLINSIIILALIINFPLWQRIVSFENKNELLQVYFLDIGQGDSILIQTPDNHFGLIDAGDGTNISRELGKVLPSYFKKFDFVLLTHPDADHVGGMVSVLKKYTVDKVFIEKVKKDTLVYQEINSIIKTKNISNFSLTSETDFNIGDVKFDVIWPEPQINTYTDLKDSNDSSISLVISYNNFSMFTAGDLPKALEDKSIFDSDEKNIDVLKVGHHGSDTSTSENFINTLKPKVSVISVGKNNKYGHPKASTLKTLEDSKTHIYRTDKDGEIILSTNGSIANIKTEINNSSDEINLD